MSRRKRPDWYTPEDAAADRAALDLAAAFLAVFGIPLDGPGRGTGADEGPNIDPFDVDADMLDRRADDRTAEVFGRV